MSAAQPRILLVEDDTVTVRLLTKALESAGGFELRTAHTGNQGLSEALRFRPDVILGDAAMPDMDGAELCRRIKSEPALSDTRFVLLTSLTGAACGPTQEICADGCLTKPVRADELLSLVRRLLQEQAVDARRPEDPSEPFVHMLIQLVDLADAGSADKALRRGAAAEWMAQDLGLSPEERPYLGLAARLQAIGKVGLPARLVRVEPLDMTAADWSAYCRYAVISYSLLRHLPAFLPAASLVQHQFENWDGSGFPSHLQKGMIPLGSRLLRVLIDFFHDLKQVTDRDLRSRRLDRLQRKAGVAYDPNALQSLGRYVHEHLDAGLASGLRCLRIEDLKAGMKLGADLLTPAGALLLRQGEQLGDEEIRLIRRHHASDPFVFSICVTGPG